MPDNSKRQHTYLKSQYAHVAHKQQLSMDEFRALTPRQQYRLIESHRRAMRDYNPDGRMWDRLYTRLDRMERAAHPQVRRASFNMAISHNDIYVEFSRDRDNYGKIPAPWRVASTKTWISWLREARRVWRRHPYPMLGDLRRADGR